MEIQLPSISVIIPTLNEEKLLPACLASIINQLYPRKKIEIIVIDDGSNDKTVSIANTYGAKVIFNGSHHIERGKSIGLQHAQGPFVFFIDSDNRLTSKFWFRDAIHIFQKHPEVVGIEGWKYLYNKQDTTVNRYCALFGINDPLTFYLGKAGFMMATKDHWRDLSTFVKEADKYFLTRFSTTNLSVIGSNGYMTKKALLLKTNWKPYLFHLDSAYDLVALGYNTFARIKYEVQHDFAKTFIDMLHKIKRNADLFLQYRHLRRYTYQTSWIVRIQTVLIMSTFIVPLIDAWRGYRKIRDRAWFLHPIMCFSVLLIDALSLCHYYIKKINHGT